MQQRVHRCMSAALLACVTAAMATPGCQFAVSFGGGPGGSGTFAGAPGVPTEGAKATQPAYIVEPPDIVLIQVLRTLPDRPLGGEKLVRSDGTIDLEYYGSLRIAGLSIEQARQALEDHLAQFIRSPKVRLDVYAYNSKYYYVLADGAGFGEQAVRLPYTGNETVIDAITQIGGLPAVSSKKKIWLARPSTPNHTGGVLPVDWIGVTQRGDSRTNYQLYPGDRVYIQSDPLIALDGFVSKIFAPLERTFGVTLLGADTIKRLQNMGREAGGGGGGGI